MLPLGTCFATPTPQQKMHFPRGSLSHFSLLFVIFFVGGGGGDVFVLCLVVFFVCEVFLFFVLWRGGGVFSVSSVMFFVFCGGGGNYLFLFVLWGG